MPGKNKIFKSVGGERLDHLISFNIFLIFPRWDRAFHFEPPFNFLLFPLPAHPSRDFASVNCQGLFTVVKGKKIIKTVAVAPKKYSINLAKNRVHTC